MKNQYLRILAAIALPTLVFYIWVILCWTPQNNIMLFFPVGALAFWSLFGAGISLSHTAQQFDNTDRITLKGEFDDEPSLWTLNGTGTRFIGVSGNPSIKYLFICFINLPIFPLGCYAAKSEGDGYAWYGYAKWRILEVAGIYLKWWGGILGGMFTIYSIAGLFY